MKIVTLTSKNELLIQAANSLQFLFQKHLNTPILFLSSGGSSFELLEHVVNISSNVSIGVLDERYSLDPELNNFAQLEATEFFKKNNSRFASVLNTKVENEETLEEFAKRFENLLRNWKLVNPQGIIVATMGMGPDGHISGINPETDKEKFNSLFNTEETWVVGYESRLKPMLRATTTFPFLRRIDYGISCITGENKRDALARLVDDEGNLEETPARILHEMKNVTIFTDIIL